MLRVGKFQSDNIAGERGPGRGGNNAGPMVSTVLRVIKGSAGTTGPYICASRGDGTEEEGSRIPFEGFPRIFRFGAGRLGREFQTGSAFALTSTVCQVVP